MSSAPQGLAPREGLGSVLMKTGRAGPPLSHAAGRRQASLGTPVPRMPTLAKPTCINDVQRLAGRVAALSRFISRLGEKAMPLYQLMKKTDVFVWSDVANAAFEDLKAQLA